MRLDFRGSVQLSARVRGTHCVNFNQVIVRLNFGAVFSAMFTNNGEISWKERLSYSVRVPEHLDSCSLLVDSALSDRAIDRRTRRAPHLRVQRWPLQ